MLARKLRSAVICPQVARGKIEKNWHVGRIVGLFDNAPLERMRVSPVGIVPKKASGKFTPIHHLSHPEGESVNDYINSLSSSVSFASFQSRNCMLLQSNTPIRTRAHMESAFQLLLEHLYGFS